MSKKGRHRETVRRAKELIDTLEEGWCFSTGYVQRRAERLWGRASPTEVETLLEVLGEWGEIRRVDVYGARLFCRGGDVKGVWLISEGRETAITAGAVEKALREIVASMKSQTFHMPSRALAELLGVKPGTVVNAAVAYLMSAVDGAHFAGLVSRGIRREKAYFVFRR